MPVSRTCKMLGMILEKEVAQDSCRVIKEKLEKFPHGYPGEIRTARTDLNHLRNSADMLQEIMTKDPGDFFITGVEVVNENQLEFDVSWLRVLSDEAVDQLYIVPAYIVSGKDRELIAFHAKLG